MTLTHINCTDILWYNIANVNMTPFSLNACVGTYTYGWQNVCKTGDLNPVFKGQGHTES